MILKKQTQYLYQVSIFLAVFFLAININAQERGDDDVEPAPPSIGADIPLTYFGPAPSQVQKELIGPYQLLKSGTLDLDAGTITLPLYKGKMKDGKTVWYIITDTNDQGNAQALGINYSPKLSYTDVGKAVRTATFGKKFTLTFDQGTVDFSPKRGATPGDAPNFFPPKSFQPGSIGDENYSPLVRIINADNKIYNAPIVAFDVSESQLSGFCEGDPNYDLVHDKVVSICPEEGLVTMALTSGFSFGRPVFYISTEANNPLPATAEGATYAPGLVDLQVGGDDSFLSPVERIFVVVNGQTGKSTPQRQGLNSALSDGVSPLNVLGGIPTIATDYSPLWDINAVVWTQKSIDAGYRSRLTEEFQILGLVEKGHVTGLNGGVFGSTGLIVNCPIVFRFL